MFAIYQAEAKNYFSQQEIPAIRPKRLRSLIESKLYDLALNYAKYCWNIGPEIPEVIEMLLALFFLAKDESKNITLLTDIKDSTFMHLMAKYSSHENVKYMAFLKLSHTKKIHEAILKAGLYRIANSKLNLEDSKVVCSAFVAHNAEHTWSSTTPRSASRIRPQLGRRSTRFAFDRNRNLSYEDLQEHRQRRMSRTSLKCVILQTLPDCYATCT